MSPHSPLPSLLSLLLVSTLSAPDLQAQTGSPHSRPSPGGSAGLREEKRLELLVAAFTSNTVHRFDAEMGASFGDLGRIPGAQAIRFGPDGQLYVCVEKRDKILRFATLGATPEEFVADDPATTVDETGGLDGPTGIAFDPAGDMLVASYNSNSILKYDGQSGAFAGEFVAPLTGGLRGPDAGMTFGPDGDLYVPSYVTNEVLLFDGETGAFIREFVPAFSGGLRNPRDLRFRSDGVLYVSSEGSGAILRYDSQGTFIDVFTQTPRPAGFVISPFDGDVFVVSTSRHRVARHDGRTGSLKEIVVPPRADGMDAPVFIEMFPDPYVRCSRPGPELASETTVVDVEGLSPSSLCYVAFGPAAGSTPIPGCAYFLGGVASPAFAPVMSDPAGKASWSVWVPPAFAGTSVFLQAWDPAGCRLSNLIEARFP